MTRKARLGVVCVVWIRRGVERLVPVGATNLADELLEQPPSPCRLSVGSVKELLAVVASFSEPPPEEAHAAQTPPATTGPTRPAARDLSSSRPTSGDGGGRRGPLCAGGGVGDALGPSGRDRLRKAWLRVLKEVVGDAQDR